VPRLIAGSTMTGQAEEPASPFHLLPFCLLSACVPIQVLTLAQSTFAC
jgi:hypothetical protein